MINVNVYELREHGRKYIGGASGDDVASAYHNALEEYGSPIEVEVQ